MAQGGMGITVTLTDPSQDIQMHGRRQPGTAGFREFDFGRATQKYSVIWASVQGLVCSILIRWSFLVLPAITMIIK